MNPSQEQFLNDLHEEKLRHKQHRVEFVKQKLFFTVGLFGIGSLKVTAPNQIETYQLLFLVPLVALAFDVFIFAEDFKVKRVGIFILEKCNPSYEEIRWEQWLSIPVNRERIALVGSVVLTFIILVSALLLLPTDKIEKNLIFYWYLGTLFTITLVFRVAVFLRNNLVMPERNNLNSFVFATYITILIVLPMIWIFWIERSTGSSIASYSKFQIFFIGSLIVYWLYCLARVAQNIWTRHKLDLREVEFKYDASKDENVKKVYLSGEFTNWYYGKIRMKEVENRKYRITIALPCGFDFQYKFLLLMNDGQIEWRPSFGEKNTVKQEFKNNIASVRSENDSKIGFFRKFFVDFRTKKQEFY